LKILKSLFADRWYVVLLFILTNISKIIRILHQVDILNLKTS